MLTRDRLAILAEARRDHDATISVGERLDCLGRIEHERSAFLLVVPRGRATRLLRWHLGDGRVTATTPRDRSALKCGAEERAGCLRPEYLVDIRQDVVDQVEHAVVAETAAERGEEAPPVAHRDRVELPQVWTPQRIAISPNARDQLAPLVPPRHARQGSRTGTARTRGLAWYRAIPMVTPNAFHHPLRPGDTETQTVGCRHTNPDICAKNQMPKVCAFARADGVCTAPPASWRKQFRRLTQLADPATEK